MRTSNKLLLGIFLSPLLVMAAINVALYAKYKSGHYVAMTTIEKDRFTRQTLKNIRYVAVYGLNNFTVRTADSAKLELEKDEHGHLHYSIQGDSLVIHGDSIVQKSGETETRRSYQSVNLYLANEAVVKADNSDVYLVGAKDSAKAKSFQFQLSNTAGCRMPEGSREDNVRQYFNVLTIQASGSSSIELSGTASIEQLNLNMQNAQFDDKDATIANFTVDADKASSLTLKGDNLKKIKP
jgi:hypothetical protein